MEHFNFWHYHGFKKCLCGLMTRSKAAVCSYCRQRTSKMNDEEKREAKLLIEDIEHGLLLLDSSSPFLTLKELHTKSLRLHKLLGGQ